LGKHDKIEIRISSTTERLQEEKVILGMKMMGDNTMSVKTIGEMAREGEDEGGKCEGSPNFKMSKNNLSFF